MTFNSLVAAMAVLGATDAATGVAFVMAATVVFADTTEDAVGLAVVVIDWALTFR